jgi:type VI secretion system protein ImpK
MNLSRLFVPLMAYVQGLDRASAPDAAVVHDQLQELIKISREQALSNEMGLQRFHEALFPVVAWADERLSRLPSWQAIKPWRTYMLQRKLFSTGLAGVQFFERLENIGPKEHDLREVYVMCLALGFIGKYSQNPQSPELATIQQNHYKLLRPEWSSGSRGALSRLFPEAYRLVTANGKGNRWFLSSKALLTLIILVPIVVIGGLVYWFDYLLAEQVSQILGRLP